MPKSVRAWIPLLSTGFLLAACSSSRDVIEHRVGGGPAAEVGAPCNSADDCDGDLTCSDEGESAGQCTVESCPSNGPGEEHGCPDDSFCYVYDGDQGHACARICETDQDCRNINPDLVCDETSSTESSGLRICVAAPEEPDADSELNSPCADGTECDTDLGLLCGGDEGEARYQCVVGDCPTAGPGEEHGCAEDAFCYVYDGDEGHYCTRTCATDGDCQTINPVLVCRERSATEEFGLKICVPGEDALPEGGGLNAYCTDLAWCYGDPALTCGVDGESANQCVFEGCSSAGVGEEHGCPEDAFCYVYDGDEGHYCTSICETDADCRERNAGLVCRERSATEELGLKICVNAD
jgi:hypothetical protein